jgi:hypothetical protein
MKNRVRESLGFEPKIIELLNVDAVAASRASSALDRDGDNGLSLGDLIPQRGLDRGPL